MPTTEVSARELLDAACAIEVEMARRSRHELESFLAAAESCEEVFEREADVIKSRAKEWVELGAPPSLRVLTGISDLEVPMNRVLGWVFNPAERRSAVRGPLRALAGLLDFKAFTEDLEREQLPEVFAERTPDHAITRRQPDVMLRTERAAVLIENKLWSPESGEGQYADYLRVLKEWAENRESRAYLLAPTKRELPRGWSGSLTHGEVAEALLPLISDSKEALWDRVVYALLANDLDPDPEPDRGIQIQHLLEGEHSFSKAVVAAKLSRLVDYRTFDFLKGGS